MAFLHFVEKRFRVSETSGGFEDVTVDAAKFDAALQKLLRSQPIPQAGVRAKSIRKMDKSTS